MSGNFFGYTKKKFLQSPYQELQFRDAPYDSNVKWSVYIPEHQNIVTKVLERETHQAEEKRQNFRQSSLKQPSRMIQSARPAPSMTMNTEPAQAQPDQTLLPRQKSVRIVEPKPMEMIIPQRSNSMACLPQRPQTAMMQSGTLKNMLTESYTPNGSSPLRRKRTLREKLYFDERTATIPKTTLKNEVIERILAEEGVIGRNQSLIDNIFKLKTLSLLNVRNPKIQRLRGVGKTNYIISDYHSRHTNPGYSRNSFGTFFAR